MNKSEVVRGGEAGANLSRKLQRLVLRQSTDAPQQRRQFFALDEFHRKKMAAIDLADVVNAADILMRNLARHAHLAMKARERGGVTQQMIGEKLERDWLREFQIVGAIDFAHAALAEQAHDAITLRQNRARHKARVVDGVE